MHRELIFDCPRSGLRRKKEKKKKKGKEKGGREGIGGHPNPKI